MDEGLKHLRAVLEHFGPLPDAAWQDVRPTWYDLHLARGDYLVEEGQHPKRLGFIRHGIIRAFYRTAEGHEYNKTFFTAGMFVCALAGLLRRTASYINLQALEDTHLLVTDYATFTNLYSRHHALERLGRRVIEEEWVKKEHRELRLVLCTAEERYAYFQQEHPTLESRIPQYHIASFLGITPVALSRIRGRMLRDGPTQKRHIPS